MTDGRNLRPKFDNKASEIPKGKGEYCELTIIKLFDRIAQQAVYQVISPIVEEQISKHSYGFRKGIGAKIPVSRLATTLNRNKDIYTIELDFIKMTGFNGIYNAARKSVANIIAMQTILLLPAKTKKSKNL